MSPDQRRQRALSIAFSEISSRLLKDQAPEPQDLVLLTVAVVDAALAGDQELLAIFGDEARTRAVFKNGEVRTGDWGFLDDGELFVVGRLDDMIPAGARNVYASAVEAAITRETAVRPGNCAIVDVPLGDRSMLVMVAEPARGEAVELREVARSAKRIAAASGGLALDECVFVPPGAFPKTPSGKVQRFRCRELVLSDRPVIERIAL